jgi:hypothetical protein
VRALIAVQFSAKSARMYRKSEGLGIYRVCERRSLFGSVLKAKACDLDERREGTFVPCTAWSSHKHKTLTLTLVTSALHCSRNRSFAISHRSTDTLHVPSICRYYE